MVMHMAHRETPTAPHPAPAPDWILGSDGHWRPPPFLDQGPRGNLQRTVVVDDSAPPRPHKVGPAVIVSVMLVIAAVAYLARVALFA